MKNWVIKEMSAIAFAIVFMTIVGLLPVVHAQEPDITVKDEAALSTNSCNLKTVRGTYGFSGEGTITASAPLPPGIPSGLYRTIGRISFDGRGALTSVVADNFNGFQTPFTNFSGTYTVNSNCTGGVQITGGVPYRFIILKDGDEILFMVDVPGTIVGGSGKRL